MDAYFIHLGSKVDKYRAPPEPRTMLQELKSLSLWRACVAELLGTALFVFVGCMAAVTSGGNVVQIGFGFGLAVMAMIYYIGHVSGGHVNPVLSLALAITRHISPLRAALYIVAQVLGGIVGSAILYGIVGDRLGDSVNGVGNGITPAQAFGNEVMLTFVLISVVYGVTDSERREYGSVALAVGLTVAVGHFAGVGVSGASMNPARSFGPVVIMGHWTDHWVYWAGPTLGAILAGVIYVYGMRPYRGIKSYEDAVKQMLSEQSQIPVPPDFQVVIAPGLSVRDGSKPDATRGFELEPKS